MDGSGGAAESRTTSPELSLGLGETDLEDAVLSQQILVLYGSHWISFFNLANAAFTVFVLRDLLPAGIFIGWIGLFCVVILARFFNSKRYLRRPPQREMAGIWGWRYAAGATATGCLWGLTAAGIFVTPNPADHAFIAFVVSGMLAGAVAGDSAFLPALAGFALPAALPLTFAFFAQGDSTSITMGFLVTAFMAVLGIIGFRSNRWIASVARREIIQRRLATDLAQRIAERQTAERDLDRSNKILQAVAESAAAVLRSLDFDQTIPKVLELIGRSLGVNCAHLYANNGATNFALFPRHIWTATGGAAPLETRGLWQSAKAKGSVSVSAFLAQRKTQFIRTNELDDADRSFLETYGIKSFLLVPVFTGEIWWGALGIGDSDATRAWSRIEIDALRTLADIVGAAIAHTRDLAEVADAGRIVENGSTMLYRLDSAPPYAVEYVSRNIERYGYTQSQFMSGPKSFMELVHPDNRSTILANITDIVSENATDAGCDFRLRMPNGSYIWFENRMHPVFGEGRKLNALEGILVDVNDRKVAETEMARLTFTDLLTALPNRAAFMNWLQKAFVEAKDDGEPFAVLYVDLDNFKDINEALGHSLGDALLKEVARRLADDIREGDRIARVGGDEFAVILSRLNDRDAIAALADRLIGSVAAPYSIGGSQLHVTASVGASIYRDKLTKPEEILRETDVALFEAKASGRNRYCFHSEALDIAMLQRVTMIDELRAALARSEFEVYYQPQVEVPSRQIIGLEALIRWNHPTRGLLTPADFIPIAEKTGIVGAIGQWVLARVLPQMHLWDTEGICPVTAVNLSAAQLISPSDFLRDLMRGLSSAQLDPGKLELELTETLLMETRRGDRDVVDRLRALGVRIAIDDFGTGYSSLEYLLNYRVGRIKIAQQFVDGLPDDHSSAAIVRATIGLAREFDIEIIAEGVETDAQLEFLMRAGCSCIQGFYFSRPVPDAQATQLLRQGVVAPAARRELTGRPATAAKREGATA